MVSVLKEPLLRPVKNMVAPWETHPSGINSLPVRLIFLAAVLKLQRAPEGLTGLVKAQITGPVPRSFQSESLHP